MQRLIFSWPIYLVCIAVLTVSFIAAWLLPVSKVINDIAVLPGVAALMGMLYQAWRDSTVHERVLELQNKQQDFVLGTASHMAEVAYDKHVAFCEEYVARVLVGFDEMIKDGPTAETFNIGAELRSIRGKHSVWLTKEIEAKLIPVENALVEIGANESILERMTTGDERSEIVAKIYKIFGQLHGLNGTTVEEGSIPTKDMIVEDLRKILGINTLTTLRQGTAELALKRISSQK